MGFIKKHLLFFLFLLGFLIRFSLIFVNYSWDVNNHMVWAKDFLVRGPQNFYETQSSNVFASATPNYPPLAIFIFVVMRFLQPLIHNLYWWLNLYVQLVPSNVIFFLEKTEFLAGLMKIPGVVADLGIAYLVFLLTKKGKFIAVSLILFNPVFIYNSSLWGQIDSIPVFFVLFSVYLLFYFKKAVLSAVLFTLALLIKPTALVFLPVYAVLFIKIFGLKKSIINLFVANIVFCLAFLPFIKGRNIFLYPYTVYSKGVLAAQSLPYVTNGAFNFWVFVTGLKGIKDTAPFLLGISYRLFGYVIVGLINLFVVFRIFKSKNKKETLFTALSISALTAFLFLTKIHERYSLLPLSFLLLASLKKPKLIGLFIIISITSLFNHYRSWSVPAIMPIINLFNSMFFIFSISLINLLIFFYLMRYFFCNLTKLKNLIN